MPPVNDDWASAITLSGSSGTTTGSNVGATVESGEPIVDTPGDGVTGTSTVWWSWTAPASGDVTWNTHGSRVSGAPSTTLDTVLDVWTGASLAGLTLVAVNDDDGVEPVNPASGGETSGLAFTAVVGTTYFLRVNCYDSQVGDIVLNWAPYVPPPPPGITSFTPTHAHVGGLITISGRGFTGATDVQFNGTSASFTVVSDTEVTATVPVGATSGPITIAATSGTLTSSTSFTVDPPGIDTVQPSTPPPGVLISARGGGLASATGAATVAGTTADNAVIGRDDRVLVETPNNPGATGPVVVTTGSYSDLTGPSVTIGPLGTPPDRARLFVAYGVGSFSSGTEYLEEAGAGEYDLTALDTDTRDAVINRTLTPSLNRSFLIWNAGHAALYAAGLDRIVPKRVNLDGTTGITYDPTPVDLSRSVNCAAEPSQGVIGFSSFITAASPPTADDLRPWITTFNPSSGAILDQYIDPDQFDNMVNYIAVTPAGHAYVSTFDSTTSRIRVIRINYSAYGTIVNTVPTTGGWGTFGISRYGNHVAVMRGLNDHHVDVWDVPVDGSTPHQLFEVVMSGDVIAFSGGSQSFVGFDHDDGGMFWVWSSNGLVSFVWVIDASGNGADDPIMFFGKDLDSLAVIGGKVNEFKWGWNF